MKPFHPTILVVDDDVAIRELLVMLLEDAGYEVRSACDGAEALVSMCDRRPDVILIDVRMPRMDGWAFRRRQQELEGYEAIPTIMMSAADRPAALDLGSAKFLAKPFSTENVLAVVDFATR